MVNSRLINDQIKRVGTNQTKLAAEMNIAQSTLNQKINNMRPMDLEEAEKLQKLLYIPDCEFGIYFFYHPVA